MNINRPLLELTFTNIAISVVANVAQPLKANGALPDMIESFILSVPSTAANSVFIGDVNVSLTSGVEVVPGAPLFFSLNQIRQMYEVQAPAEILAKTAGCEPDYLSEAIPFICFNLFNMWVVASANTTFSLMTFKTPWM